MTQQTDMVDFSELAQQVWTAQSIESKRAVLYTMVDNFKYRGKNNSNLKTFKSKISGMTLASAMDKMAADLALNNTDKVVNI